jgi:FAD/FMN-containing dehydrogenase
VPGSHVCAFGHVGDGNVHFNITQPDDMDRASFLGRWGEVNDRVHACVARLDGSISAEHGIGLLKVHEVNQHRSPVETRLQAALKRALDPENIMNPGKLVAP